MSKQKAAHYRGRYHQAALKLRAAANANPDTRCWRCKRTMAEIRRVKPKAKWTAGHLYAGVPDSPLLPECSPCNYGHGARLVNARRKPPAAVTGLRW